jgi:hypothetical protein
MTNHDTQPPGAQQPSSKNKVKEKEHIEEAVVSLDSPEPTTLDGASRAAEDDGVQPVKKVSNESSEDGDAEHDTETERLASDHVRVAGRKEMETPPREWDVVDEESDESFPASDPPANY